jgi:hypothetical protein
VDWCVREALAPAVGSRLGKILAWRRIVPMNWYSPAVKADNMTQQRFGTIADLFKHVALTQVLTQLRPAEYWESHAGLAMHEENGETTPARQHGIHTFCKLAAASAELRATAYARALGPVERPVAVPGSTLLARRILGDRVRRLLLCDTDAVCLQSIQKHLKGAAANLKELSVETLECVQDDGISVLRGAGMQLSDSWKASTLALLDPDEITALTAADISPLELACELGNRGVATLLAYRFDDEATRQRLHGLLGQALARYRLASRAVRLEGSLKAPREAQVPWGFGLLALNLSPQTLEAVERDLRVLEAAYADAVIEGGSGKVTGAWTCRRTAGG